MKRTYQVPQTELFSIYAKELMQASGVYGDGTASDITYGGVDGDKEPQAKEFHGYSVWDE